MKNVSDVYPLTPTQAGMLFHSVAAPGSGVYVEQISARVRGPVDPNRFRNAWQEILNRHSVLRTAFLWDGLDEPMQVVRKSVDLRYEYVDMSATDHRSRQVSIESLLADDRTKGFDLESAPLMRVRLIRMNESEHLMIWSFHHILCDGWSSALLLEEVLAAYEDEVRTEPIAPYRDYVAWLQNRDVDADLSYWKTKLDGYSGTISVPTSADTERSGTLHVDRLLSEELSQRLRKLGVELRVTMNTLLQGAWAILIGRYTNVTDVVFGSTLAGRPPELDQFDRMIGLFVNTMPIRADLHGAQAVTDFLGDVQSTLLDAQDHQYVPLVEIRRQARIQSHGELFSTIVVFENYPTTSTDTNRGILFEDLDYREQSNYPLALLVVPDTMLRLMVFFDSSRYSNAATERMLTHLSEILEYMVSRQDGRIGDISLVSSDEARQLNAWSGVPGREPEGCVTSLIDRSIEQVSTRVAMRDANEELTYEQYGRKVADISARLVELGVTGGDHVGIILPRSQNAIAAMVAVLKIGAVYVPIDPDYPRRRVEHMLTDARCKAIITDVEALSTDTDYLVLDLRKPAASSRAKASHEIVRGPQPQDLAYVMFTSGSTGLPKGVAVTHDNLYTSTTARSALYGRPPERFLLLPSLSFDSSVAGIYWTLATGGSLIIAEPHAEQDMVGLARTIARERATHILCLPTIYRMLLEFAEDGALATLQVVIVAGEACPKDLGALHFQAVPECRLFNEYGPTEATVWSSAFEILPTWSGSSVPIGKPIRNCGMYILDRETRRMPIGIPGELYIGGRGVAAGYLGHEKETREKFVSVKGLPHERLYRTGDVGRVLESGDFDFLGRVDEQVKIRGFRVEPAEIESLFRAQKYVRDVVVTLIPSTQSGSSRPGSGAIETAESSTNSASRNHPTSSLAAFVVSASPSMSREQTVAELGDLVSAHLPQHLRPSKIFVVDTIPLLPNGKVDRRQLESLALDERPRLLEKPRTKDEATLTMVWQNVLGLSQVGVNENFFELGGDSIVSIRLTSALRQAGYAVKPGDVFEWPTIAQLARVVTRTRETKRDRVSIGSAPLTPIQHWFFELAGDEPGHWNLAFAFEVSRSVDSHSIGDALRMIMKHHEALRTRFGRNDEGNWFQFIDPPSSVLAFETVRLSHPEDELETTITTILGRIQTEIQPHLTVSCKFVFFDLGPTKDGILALVAHHLVVDALSWDIILRDLDALIHQSVLQQPFALPAPSSSIIDWALALSKYARTSEAEAEIEYWLRHTSAVSTLPTDFDPPEVTTESDVDAVETTVDAGVVDKLLHDVPRLHSAKPHEVVLAAFLDSVRKWSGSDQLVVGMEGHGRNPRPELSEFDLSRTVGWITAAYPQLFDLRECDSHGALLRTVKECVRSVPNGGIGYGVLRYLSSDRSSPLASPPPQILYNYLGSAFGDTAALRYLRAKDIDVGSCRNSGFEHEPSIETNIVIRHGKMEVEWRYVTLAYRLATIQQLSRSFEDCLRALVEHCTRGDERDYSPSDFPDIDLGQDKLDKLLASITGGDRGPESGR